MEGRKLGFKSTIWNIKKKKHLNRTARRKKNPKKIESRLRSLWDNFKHTNIHIILVPEGDEREQEIGNLFENIMTENFPSLMKEIDIQV